MSDGGPFEMVTSRPSWVEALAVAGDRPLLLGLSGGADSAFLAEALVGSGREVRALHVDHGLRPEAAASEAEHCRSLCAELAIPLRVTRVALAPDGPGLEERARRARYGALLGEAARLGWRHVVTAHHADDRLETFVQRWVRGDAFASLAGPRVVRRLAATGTAQSPVLLRPLLSITAEEIRAALSDAGRTWCEDASNASPRFTRNRIRNLVLPALAHRDPDALATLRRLTRSSEARARREEREAETLLSQVDPKRLALPLEELRALEPARLRGTLWKLCERVTGGGPGQRMLARLISDLGASRRASHTLGPRWRVELDERELRFEEARAGGPAPSELALVLPGSTRLFDGRVLDAALVEPAPPAPPPRDPLTVELDARDLRAPLVVRPPRPGDRLRPLGSSGRKRVTRLLAEAGVPAADRARVPLVVAGDELLWVVGVRPAHERRVRPDTRLRLRLAVREAGPSDAGGGDFRRGGG